MNQFLPSMIPLSIENAGMLKVKMYLLKRLERSGSL
jgi:hypothetical protein